MIIVLVPRKFICKCQSIVYVVGAFASNEHLQRPTTDLYSVAVSLPILTSACGFCEGVDSITIPAPKLSLPDAGDKFPNAMSEPEPCNRVFHGVE